MSPVDGALLSAGLGVGDGHRRRADRLKEENAELERSLRIIERDLLETTDERDEIRHQLFRLRHLVDLVQEHEREIQFFGAGDTSEQIRARMAFEAERSVYW